LSKVKDTSPKGFCQEKSDFLFSFRWGTDHPAPASSGRAIVYGLRQLEAAIPAKHFSPGKIAFSGAVL
jgi:hypothetical protein